MIPSSKESIRKKVRTACLQITLMLILGGIFSTPGFSEISFSAKKPVDLSAVGARYVSVADIDGDGINEVFAASETDDQIAWYGTVWDSTLTFVKHVITEDPNSNYYDGTNGYANGPQSLFAVDLDQDGHIDLLSASENDDRIAWYENTGFSTPSFISHTISTSPEGARAVFAADLDADGDIDVLSAAYDDINYLSFEVAWYENDGANPPGFTRRVIDDFEARYPEWVYAVDLDDDDDMDVLVADSEYIHCFKNNGATDPTFSSSWVSPFRDADRSAYPCDLDGDGAVDILAVSARYSKIVWYENNQDSPLTFTPHDIMTSISSPRSVYPADVDGDGDLDFGCVTSGDDTLSWYENIGGATSFTPHSISNSVDGAEYVTIADMDSDGDLDFLCAGYDDDTIWFFENATYQPAPEVDVHRRESEGPIHFYARITDGVTTVDFYTSLQGSDPYQRRFYVSNRGAPDLTTANLTVPAGYSIVEPLAATIPRGTTETFLVELSTDNPGTFTGSISFNTNDSDENPFDFPVIGKVIAPEIEVSAEGTPLPNWGGPINFGQVNMGEPGPSRTFTVSNTGDALLQIANFTVPTGFLVTESLDTTIYTSQLDTFTLQLDTSQTGYYSGYVSFNNNDVDENPFSFSIAGKVVTPEIAVYDGTTYIPSGGGPVDFGTVAMGSPTVSKTFTIQNTGTADLHIMSMGYYGGRGAFDYSIVSANPIIPGGSATFSVSLLTATSGIDSATFTINNNDVDENPYTFRMTGEILEPTFTPTPTSTQTPIASSTFTATPTSSTTPTPTDTQTPIDTSATSTPTATPTLTDTPLTPSPTSTQTSTSTASWTPTMTATITTTVTATSTQTFTLTPTQSGTPTMTHTPLTPSPTLTETPTGTSTQTPTLSVTETSTETQTTTPSMTVSQTPTQTQTASNTSTLTPTLSSTPTPTHTASVTPTASVTDTPTEHPTQTLTPTESPDYDLSPDGNIDEKDLLVLIHCMCYDQLVDFNGDGKADKKDVFLFCVQWGK